MSQPENEQSKLAKMINELIKLDGDDFTSFEMSQPENEHKNPIDMFKELVKQEAEDSIDPELLKKVINELKIRQKKLRDIRAELSEVKGLLGEANKAQVKEVEDFKYIAELLKDIQQKMNIKHKSDENDKNDKNDK